MTPYLRWTICPRCRELVAVEWGLLTFHGPNGGCYEVATVAR